MFEDQQDAVNNLLANDENFQLLYQQHKDLKTKVRDADIGATPMDPFTLDRLKKEKLLLKDKMATIIASYKKQ